MLTLLGQVPVRAAVDLTSATLPEPAASEIDPVASGVGRIAPFAPPDVSWIKKYCPGASLIPVNGVTDHVDAAALAY